MSLILLTDFDDASGQFELRSYRIKETSEVRLDQAAIRAYSKALLRLFVSYRVHSLINQASDDFTFAASPTDVEAISQLVRASRKNGHWSMALLQHGKSTEEKERRELLEKTRGRDELKVTAALLDAKNIKIFFRQTELNSKENLDVFTKLLDLSATEAGRTLLRSSGIRENLRYQVDFFDQSPSVKIDAAFRTLDYQHFEASLKFERQSLVAPERLAIGLIDVNEDLELSSSIAETPRGVIYREVFSVRKSDRQHFKQLIEASINAPREERIELLAKVFSVAFKVDDELVELEKIEERSGRYYLHFTLPQAAKNKLSHSFDICITGFQPRSVCSIPMVISEPTCGANLVFRWEHASIDSPAFFVGAQVGSEALRPRGKLRADANLFELSTPDGSFMQPGEGAVVYWSPLQKNDRVKLVGLEDFDNPPFVLEARYSTENNRFQKKLTRFKGLLLVEEAAKDLHLALKQLYEEYGWRIKVWDAYRPLYVQRLMYDSVSEAERPYVANPDSGSRHNRGCAVDITLVDDSGKELCMPTGFDEFTEAAHWSTIDQGEDSQQKRHACVLRKIMTDHNFLPIDREWWHFDHCNWRRYPILDIEPYRNTLDVE